MKQHKYTSNFVHNRLILEIPENKKPNFTVIKQQEAVFILN